MFLLAVLGGLTVLNFFFPLLVFFLHGADPSLVILNDLVVLLQPFAILLLSLDLLLVVLFNSFLGLFLVLQLEGYLFAG